jgi:hypothetical protein
MDEAERSTGKRDAEGGEDSLTYTAVRPMGTTPTERPHCAEEHEDGHEPERRTPALSPDRCPAIAREMLRGSPGSRSEPRRTPAER